MKCFKMEDVLLYKLEISNNFYGQHILPLGEFYKQIHKI
jgi:hypothetical protein